MGLVELRPTLIRGNASEVLAVAGELGGGRGVDSTAGPAEALPLGKRLARDAACVVAISGATDLARARPPPAPRVRNLCLGAAARRAGLFDSPGAQRLEHELLPINAVCSESVSSVCSAHLPGMLCTDCPRACVDGCEAPPPSGTHEGGGRSEAEWRCMLLCARAHQRPAQRLHALPCGR